MHVLRNYVSQIEGLERFLEAAARNPLTQGVALDMNPIWYFGYCISRSGLQPEPFFDPWHFPFPHAWGLDEIVRFDMIEGDAVDFGWIDNTGWVARWTHYLVGDTVKPIGETVLPFLVKAIAKPSGFNESGARDELIALVRSQPFFAIVETRPLGSLALSPGDGCVAGGTPGTIGGFLRDRMTEKVYATTCGHVAQAGVSVTVLGAHIGHCTFSKPPVPLAPSQPCTRGCPNTNRLDFALVDVGNAVPANNVTGIAARIASRQDILLRGNAGAHDYEVGALMITYCPGNSNVCFENMFEVRPKNAGGILRASLRAVLATVPARGDSGAWIETASSSEWCGVLVAADGLMGYALEADDTIIEANREFGTDLTLI